MKMVADRTGRFAERPYYDAAELDRDCECLVSAFLNRRAERSLPLHTHELTILIEEAGASLDSCVDLSAYGPDVDGMTAFPRGRDPEVSISERLSAPNRENRLRSTLAHEYGHVRFHRTLWESKYRSGLFDDGDADRICQRRSKNASAGRSKDASVGAVGIGRRHQRFGSCGQAWSCSSG